MMNTRTPTPQDSCAWQLPAVFLTARVPSIFWHRLILAVLVETCHIQDMARPNRPRDTNQLAKAIVDLATGEVEPEPNHSLTELRASKAGKKGGPARAAALTPEERSRIASIAAQARWRKND